MELYKNFSLSYGPLSASGLRLLKLISAKGVYNRSTIFNSKDSTVSKYIDHNVISFLAGRGLLVRGCELFYYPTNFTSMIHTDGADADYMMPGNMAKINYISNSSGGVLNWYTPKVTKISRKNNYSNNYASFTADQVNLLYSKHLVGYNIVQTGIPHNVTTTEETRYTVSFTVTDATNKLMPYELLASKIFI